MDRYIDSDAHVTVEGKALVFRDSVELTGNRLYVLPIRRHPVADQAKRDGEAFEQVYAETRIAAEERVCSEEGRRTTAHDGDAMLIFVGHGRNHPLVYAET